MAELSIFQYVKDNRPAGNRFDLSYSKHLTTNFGILYPVLADECVPGDYWQIGAETAVRLQPLLAPLMDSIDITVDYFFVPYRLLYEDWQKFITGGKKGTFTGNLPLYPWARTNSGSNNPEIMAAKNTLWDALGLPLPSDINLGDKDAAYLAKMKTKPLAFPWLAYNMIHFYYYQDQNLTLSDAEDWDEVPDEPQPQSPNPASYNKGSFCKYSNTLRNRAYVKDYFTSALPFQQRGTAPSIPLSGFLPVSGAGIAQVTTAATESGNTSLNFYAPGDTSKANPNQISSSGEAVLANFNVSPESQLGVDLSTGGTFTVPELRTIFQIQKWMELNARAGSRYIEFLQAHFGISPTDETLQRPEFLGRIVQPVVISEVLQTSQSSTDSVLGEFAGHGISYSSNFIDGYKVKEFGIVVGLMSIMPKSTYFQGINRQWLRRSRFDFYFPEFANLSEQGIYNAEIFVRDDTEDPDNDFVDTVNGEIFGFQGNNDEMRIKQNMVTGMMRDTFDYWHLARKFATPPELNEDFITVKADDFKRVFAVQDEDPFIVNFRNILSVDRPMPAIPDPGLIDHTYGR